MRNSLLLLGELTDEDVDWLRQAGEKITIPAEEALIQQGHPIQALYLLLDGALVVKASSPSNPQEQRTVAHLATGEVIGEMSFVDHRLPSATVIAETDAVLLAVPQAQLLERSETDLAFGKRFYRGLAFCLSNRLRSMNVNLPQAGRGSSEETPDGIRNPDVAANEAAARVRLESLIASAK
ncbi:MAG TPA: cyclic nucleotide-binding domain-containing protein [Leptolyngbyaceae cyanobacterium]